MCYCIIDKNHTIFVAKIARHTHNKKDQNMIYNRINDFEKIMFLTENYQYERGAVMQRFEGINLPN